MQRTSRVAGATLGCDLLSGAYIVDAGDREIEKEVSGTTIYAVFSIGRVIGAVIPCSIAITMVTASVAQPPVTGNSPPRHLPPANYHRRHPPWLVLEVGVRITG